MVLVVESRLVSLSLVNSYASSFTEVAIQFLSLLVINARAWVKEACLVDPTHDIIITILEIIHQNNEEFSAKRIDKSLCKSSLTAEMVTSFSPPNVSVISTMGCRTFKKISITEISESLGIKSVFLTSLRVAHRG